MKALIQRVSFAKVTVDNELFSKINKGILVFVGIETLDDDTKIKPLFNKILNYRIFPDHEDKINLSVKEIQGEIMLIPQFTLAANTKKGLRPGFSTAKNPDDSKHLFHSLVEHAKKTYDQIQMGSFQSDMSIDLCNEGPITFLLEY